MTQHIVVFLSKPERKDKPKERSPYTTGDGRTLWTYDDGGDDETDDEGSHVYARIIPRLPGSPRSVTLKLAEITGSAIYKGLEMTVTSRPYRSGLNSLKGDGSDTPFTRGGYTLLKETCSSTAVKFISAVDLPTKGFQLEHLREVNTLNNFVRSLLQQNKLDPMAVYRGWNKAYTVSLPLIGVAVRDRADYTFPTTLNDRIFETIGSYAYREGVSFLPGSLNLLKRTLMMRNIPLGKNGKMFHNLLDAIARTRDEASLKKLLATMQGTVAVFNYLNDALKGILAAWKELEPDYYDHVVANAQSWLSDVAGKIVQNLAGNTVNSLNAGILVSEAAQIRSQIGQIKSPLSG
ncbi:hypothetical protein E4U19_005696 [Claviceps sp. Clav32 group G5]|nr:hypothetical protein E4U19_005696 [Claviceps sp. Clav32 group G5]